jgi:toxin ParE1/3/4
LPVGELSRNRQIAYVAERNPQAAIKLGDAIEAAVMNLSRYPKIGRAGRVEGTRELVVDATPYLIVYRIEKETLVILRVLHGAQRWPAKP